MATEQALFPPRAAIADALAAASLVLAVAALAGGGMVVHPQLGLHRVAVVIVLGALALAAGSVDSSLLLSAPTWSFVIAAAILVGPVPGGIVGALSALRVREPRAYDVALGTVQGVVVGLVVHAASRLDVFLLSALGVLVAWAVSYVAHLPRERRIAQRLLAADAVAALALVPAFVVLSRKAGLLETAVLGVAVVGGFDVFRRERERLVDLHQRFEEQARTDSLTGIANRRAFEERLRLELARLARGARGAGLLVVDLDHFKAVNDTHGHEAGDTVLVCIASRLRRSTRATDLVARLGGDEFAVVLSDVADLAAVEAAATAVRRALTADPTAAYRGVTVSIGGAMARIGDDPASLLRRADASAYEAKRERDCVVVA